MIRCRNSEYPSGSKLPIGGYPRRPETFAFRLQTTMRTRLIPIALCLAGLTVFSPPGLAQTDPIKKGRWDERNEIPDGWVVVNSRFYQVQSACGREKAKRLGKHMDAMFKIYHKIFRPSKAPTKRYPIKLLKDRKAYLKYGAPRGSAAYFSRTDKEMVCYDTGRWHDEPQQQEGPITPSGEPKGDLQDALEKLKARLRKQMSMDLLGVAAHEGWHQYFAWYVGSVVSLPSWINEGMGDYFYAVVPKRGKGADATPQKTGLIFPQRLAVIKYAVKNNSYVPIAKIIRYAQRDYYRNASVCYAEGWSLCQFLMHAPNKKYNKVIPKFVKRVKNDTNMKAVTDYAFRGIDLAKLEQEWKAWVLGVDENGNVKEQGKN